jgi:phospholipase C
MRPRSPRRPLTALLSGTAVAAALLLAPLATAAAPRSLPGLEGIPHFDHVVLLVEENESATSTFSPASPATYLKGLRAKGVFLPNYYGTGHASLDNYVSMVSGQPPLPHTMGDCAGLSLWECVQPQRLVNGGRNLADQLEEAHLSWRSYQDGTSTPCFHAPYSATDPTPDPYQGNSKTGARNYADRHNPFLYFPDVIEDPARCAAHQRPFTDLARDLRRNTLPAFSFLTPDTCHDGHDDPCADGTPGGLRSADAFLRRNLPALQAWLARHNGLLVVTFDEAFTPSDPADIASHRTDYLCSGCALGGLGGRTGAILVSPRLRQGHVDQTGYDHFSLLRTVEDSFRIGEHLGLAGRATPMTVAFAGARR